MPVLYVNQNCLAASLKTLQDVVNVELLSEDTAHYLHNWQPGRWLVIWSDAVVGEMADSMLGHSPAAHFRPDCSSLVRGPHGLSVAWVSSGRIYGIYGLRIWNRFRQTISRAFHRYEGKSSMCLQESRIAIFRRIPLAPVITFDITISSVMLNGQILTKNFLLFVQDYITLRRQPYKNPS